MPKSRPVQERFWEKVLKTDSCWNWTAAKTGDGYGKFGIKPKLLIDAHRFSYQTLVGEIPCGLELDHLCRNPGCVNPEHLEAVTHSENILRGYSHPCRKCGGPRVKVPGDRARRCVACRLAYHIPYLRQYKARRKNA